MLKYTKEKDVFITSMRIFAIQSVDRREKKKKSDQLMIFHPLLIRKDRAQRNELYR